MKNEDILNIEREALILLDEIRKKRNMTQNELGEKAFPDDKNPRLKVSGFWNGRGKGKDGLRLRLGDFCTMSYALGRNPAQELLLILGKIENMNNE